MRTQHRLALIILLLAVLLSIGTYTRLWSLHVPFGLYLLHHWFAIIPGLYLLFTVPLFSYLKRFTKLKKSLLLKIHVFGNLLAVIIISLHFSHHLGRPPEFAPSLGTGITTYILLVMIVATGFMLHFGILAKMRQSWYVFHAGVGVSQFIALIVHTLKNFGILV